MKEFKLLAIRPRKGCYPQLLKNLSGEQLYPLYSSFTFYNDKEEQVDRLEGEISTYRFESLVPKRLYELPPDERGRYNDIQFNLSAIAGKNGSGKSSLIDLFFAAIFVMSVKKNVLTPKVLDINYHIQELEKRVRDLKSRYKELEKTRSGFAAAFNKAIRSNITQTSFEEAERAVKEQLRRESLMEQQLNNSLKELTENRNKLIEYDHMAQRTRVDILYQDWTKVYQLCVSPDLPEGVVLYEIPLNEGSQKEVKLSLATLPENFFYTIAINYSHYALNSNYLGEWIRLLFHKNDGYQTPLVISPMRTNGNFDINSEMGFAKTRLLFNVLMQRLHLPRGQEDVELTDNQVVTEVVFTLNKPKINRLPKYVYYDQGQLLGKDERAKAMLRDFFRIAVPGKKDLELRPFPLLDVLLNYIVKKIDTISEHYPGFQPGYVYNEDPPKEHNENLLRKMYQDTSHVTYKLHQATNFLKYCLEAESLQEFAVYPADLKGNKRVEFSFSLLGLFDWMGNPSDEELIQYLPPSIFEVDFKLSNSRKTSYWFSALSSGEQQFIHTIQAVVYHLNNIQSAHNNPDRVKYRAVNIILDEIELYFHPDFQRKFISKLLRAISRIHLNHRKHIETINLLFLTHSPFILSDIPSENVMRLKFNKSKGKSFPVKGDFETFAANIHELLAKSFFIEGTSMGEFAEDKLDALIDRIKSGNEPTAEDTKLINLVGDSFLRSSLKQFRKRQND